MPQGESPPPGKGGGNEAAAWNAHTPAHPSFCTRKNPSLLNLPSHPKIEGRTRSLNLNGKAVLVYLPVRSKVRAEKRRDNSTEL